LVLGPHPGRTVAGIHRFGEAFEVIFEQMRVPIGSDLCRRMAQHSLYCFHAGSGRNLQTGDWLMLRGEMWFVDLDPARIGEADKRSHTVIVSNDGANTTAARLGRGVVTAVPVTSNVDRVDLFQVPLPAAASGPDRDSKTQAEEVRLVSVERVSDKIGSVPPGTSLDVDDALRLHFALWDGGNSSFIPEHVRFVDRSHLPQETVVVVSGPPESLARFGSQG
jgi:mRNA interferase MazF